MLFIHTNAALFIADLSTMIQQPICLYYFPVFSAFPHSKSQATDLNAASLVSCFQPTHMLL